jgi:hypothetical protein
MLTKTPNIVSSIYGSHTTSAQTLYCFLIVSISRTHRAHTYTQPKGSGFPAPCPKPRHASPVRILSQHRLVVTRHSLVYVMQNVQKNTLDKLLYSFLASLRHRTRFKIYLDWAAVAVGATMASADGIRFLMRSCSSKGVTALTPQISTRYH